MAIDQRLPRALIVLLTAAGAVGTLAGVRAVSSIVGPVLLALVLVIAVAPVRVWLARRGAPTWVLVLVPLLIVFLVLLGMLATITFSVVQVANLIPTYSQEFDVLMAQALRLAERFGVGSAQVNHAIASFDPGKVLELVQTLFSSLLGVLSSLLLIVVVLLAMCLDAPAFARILSAGAGHRPHLITALAAFTSKTRRYLVVSTVFGLICAVLDAGALYLLSVPLPVLWGVLALITNYIPNIGFVIGLAPPALLGLLDGGVRTMILVIVAYSLINVVIQSFVQPKFLGDAVGLNTTMTLLSLIVWTFVLGPLGALLAIPLSLLTRALLIDSDPSAGWAAALISGERPPPAGPEPRDRPPAPRPSSRSAPGPAGRAPVLPRPGEPRPEP
ncbi:AI-2E family transporter [Microtetraspora sp. NBRC 13810]|uniref:AI-2E family transporter n=1 Tax=Microtetraspora sp. NBRC 13810 TaxID=3030990 RepID=UPI0024A17494|nr:AI-2E family transporter [Microtetraspora sp. NBRC 13810]GLW04874.1 AI-2E family transporter [Microtetraspora sp. NBRC 13810]